MPSTTTASPTPPQTSSPSPSLPSSSSATPNSGAGTVDGLNGATTTRKTIVVMSTLPSPALHPTSNHYHNTIIQQPPAQSSYQSLQTSITPSNILMGGGPSPSFHPTPTRWSLRRSSNEGLPNSNNISNNRVDSPIMQKSSHSHHQQSMVVTTSATSSPSFYPNKFINSTSSTTSSPSSEYEYAMGIPPSPNAFLPASGYSSRRPSQSLPPSRNGSSRAATGNGNGNAPDSPQLSPSLRALPIGIVNELSGSAPGSGGLEPDDGESDLVIVVDATEHFDGENDLLIDRDDILLDEEEEFVLDKVGLVPEDIEKVQGDVLVETKLEGEEGDKENQHADDIAALRLSPGLGVKVDETVFDEKKSDGENKDHNESAVNNLHPPSLDSMQHHHKSAWLQKWSQKFQRQFGKVMGGNHGFGSGGLIGGPAQKKGSGQFVHDPNEDMLTPRQRRQQYKYIKLLGSGAQGSVSLRLHTPSNSIVALKAINTGMSQVVDDVRKAFRREVALLKMSSIHPNIIRLLDSWEGRSTVYQVFDVATGGDLTTGLKGPIPENEATRLIAPIVDAVRFLHDFGILHRDVRPANILLRRPVTGRESLEELMTIPVLSDFGIATMEKYSGRLGTRFDEAPAHIAIEVVKGGRFTKRADCYGLGVVAIQVLLGRGIEIEDSDPRFVPGDVFWRRLSEVGKGWVRGLLERNHERRMTAKEAIESEWFKIWGAEFSGPAVEEEDVVHAANVIKELY
ncbi:Calcium/calmodulin-dependent protein kinase type 1 [Blyttiomyces sp. JEL0837]|nr:Calcium/calmodulin-dependent protein kinase type 1 [Blyttiomyces sp. JEL0837]